MIYGRVFAKYNNFTAVNFCVNFSGKEGGSNLTLYLFNTFPKL